MKVYTHFAAQLNAIFIKIPIKKNIFNFFKYNYLHRYIMYYICNARITLI